MGKCASRHIFSYGVLKFIPSHLRVLKINASLVELLENILLQCLDLWFRSLLCSLSSSFILLRGRHEYRPISLFYFVLFRYSSCISLVVSYLFHE